MDKKKITFSLQNSKPVQKKVEEIVFYEKYKYLPSLGKTGTLHKVKTRTIYKADLEAEVILKYQLGQYRYFDEISGKDCYYTEPIPGVIGKKRHTNKTILQATEPAIRDEMSLKASAEQARNLLHLKTVPSTIWKWTDIIEIDEKSRKEIEQKTLEAFSGHTCVDEVYEGKNAVVFITDPVTDTILLGTPIDGSVTNDVIIGEFKKLKEKNLDVKSVTRDGSPLYMNTIQTVFLLVCLQICVFHLIKTCLKYFMNWHKKIRQEMKTEEVVRGMKGSARKLKDYIFRHRTLFVKKFLTGAERKIAKTLMEAFPEFYQIRRLFLKLMRMFSAVSLKEATRRYWDFIAEPDVGEKLGHLGDLLQKHFDRNELFVYLTFDPSIRKAIRTSNHVERTNRKFRKKQKTHYRIRKPERKAKMIELMIYFYNSKSLGMGNGALVAFIYLQRFGICFK
jgi:hypothetical protein